MKNNFRDWFQEKPDSFGKNIPAMPAALKKPVPVEAITPLDFFKLFVTDKFVEKIRPTG